MYHLLRVTFIVFMSIIAKITGKQYDKSHKLAFCITRANRLRLIRRAAKIHGKLC